MKKIHLVLPSALKKHMPNIEMLDVDGGTLEDVFSALEDNYQGVTERLLDEGEVRPFLKIFIGETDIKTSGGLNTPIKDGDQLTVLLSHAGG